MCIPFTIMGEKQFLLVEDHPEGGEMMVTNKYSGGGDISTFGVGSGAEEVILTTLGTRLRLGVLLTPRF